MRLSARVGAGAAFGVWLADVAVLAASHGRASTRQWLAGAAAALFVSLSTTLVVSSVVGPVVIWLRRHATGGAHWRTLFRNDAGRSQRILTAELCAFFMLGAWSWLGHRAIVAIELGIARPDNMVLGLTAFSWVFLASVVLAWPWCHGAAAVLVERAAKAPLLRRLLSDLWPLNTLGAIAVAFVLARFPPAGVKWELSAIPWQRAISLAGLIPGLACVLYLPRIARPWSVRLQRVLDLLAAGAMIAAVPVAVRLRPEWSVVRTLAFDRALGGRIGYAAWTAAFDFDRDGQLGILGGGDCAAFDPNRFTGAVETLDNGVDEDCDGADLKRQSLEARPRLSVGQELLPRPAIVVLVTIDALSAPKLTALGNPTSLMPHLDELASRSKLFTHCFSEGPSTRLSFPSIFTSRWDSQLAWQPGATIPHSFASSERQIQDIFDDAGYETVAVIPQDYFDRDRWPSITRGFQRIERSAIPFGLHNAPQVTDAALRVLSEDRTRPLYLWMHYYDAHAPYLRLPGVQYPDGPNEALSLHNAELHYIDGELGRLIAALDQRTEPTYVIVTSDHATVFHPDPTSRRGHYGFDLYTATLHVPLLVHGPRIAPGRSEGVVSTMDVAPTIADMLRVDGAKFEGTSLMPELLANMTDTQRVIFHEFYLPERIFHGYEPLEIVSLHTSRWNLILNRGRGVYELYDFTRDYFEQDNLYEEQARSPEVMHLKSILGTFMERFAAGVHSPPLPRSDDPIFKMVGVP